MPQQAHDEFDAEAYLGQMPYTALDHLDDADYALVKRAFERCAEDQWWQVRIALEEQTEQLGDRMPQLKSALALVRNIMDAKFPPPGREREEKHV